MEVFYSKEKLLGGSKYPEVSKRAWRFYRNNFKKSRRRDNIRSIYFGNEKIFIGLFWSHLKDKHNLKIRTRRLKFIKCAFDLIRHSHSKPYVINVSRKTTLYRFFGKSKDGELFAVQIKENIYNNQKFLMSFFPINKKAFR